MDSRETLISVIVPVHNGQNYLESCIRSIENQTCGNLEVIIINDGSVDGTVDVCGALQAAYDNVHVITLDDRGVSAARNAGLDRAAGVFVTFVDADDRLHPAMLQTLSDCMTRTGSDIVGCRFFSGATRPNGSRRFGRMRRRERQLLIMRTVISGTACCRATAGAGASCTGGMR